MSIPSSPPPPFSDPSAPSDQPGSEDLEMIQPGPGQRARKPPKPRIPIPKIDAELLLSEKGLPWVKEQFGKRFRSRGKGYEAEDLENLCDFFCEWTHELYPRLQYQDVVKRIEKECTSKRMKVYREGLVKAFFLPREIARMKRDDDFIDHDTDDMNDIDEQDFEKGKQPFEDYTDSDDSVLEKPNELPTSKSVPLQQAKLKSPSSGRKTATDKPQNTEADNADDEELDIDDEQLDADMIKYLELQEERELFGTP